MPAFVKNNDAEIKFYFVVPEDIYDNFKYQNIRNT